LRVEAENIAKKFAYERIFKHISFRADCQSPLAFVGHNGSGKSTLLKITAGMMPLSEGKISYFQQNTPISGDNIFRMLSLATPYQQLPEELTLVEVLNFHEKFKRFTLPKSEIQARLQFSKAQQAKSIKYFSSGMKQKLKLALALFSDVPLLFLDEPTANFDKKNTEWYLAEIEEIVEQKQKVIFVASNQPHEYFFCQNMINLNQSK